MLTGDVRAETAAAADGRKKKKGSLLLLGFCYGGVIGYNGVDGKTSKPDTWQWVGLSVIVAVNSVGP